METLRAIASERHCRAFPGCGFHHRAVVGVVARVCTFLPDRNRMSDNFAKWAGAFWPNGGERADWRIGLK
jgi:hypothetical protein